MKCALGLHHWSKPEFTKTKIIYKCQSCPKVKVHFIPPKVILMSELTDIAVNGAIASLLIAAGYPKMAHQFVQTWKEDKEKATKLDQNPFSTVNPA